MVVSSVIAGASGGALANVALSPLGGGAGMLQSYWYGAGLILGERMMYTFHWEKINARIKKGEDFLSVLESEMNPAITAIASYSLIVMKKTASIYMQGGVDFMAKLIENMFKLVAGESIDPVFPSPDLTPTDEPTAPTPSCPSGFRWSASAQQCVPEDIPEPGPVPQDPLIPSTVSAVESPKNAKYLVSPGTYCKGRVILGRLIGASMYALQSNVSPGTPNGDWRTVKIGERLTLIEDAKRSWPLPGSFKFWSDKPPGSATYWATDLR